MKDDYDIVVIGGGASGLVAATEAASLGAKTALIEKSKSGVDYIRYGCVSSKAFLKAAHNLSMTRRLKDFGINMSDSTGFDTGGVMSFVRGMRDNISSHHPSEVFEKKRHKGVFW